MVHLYYGDGKGKTTAAFGLVLRALGAGWSVCVVQFLKDGSSSEVGLLRGLGATVLADESPVKFTFQMDAAEKTMACGKHDANLTRALELVDAASGDAPGCLLVLDEALDALGAGLLDESLVRKALTRAALSETRELVVTGHTAPDFVRAAADYVTRMQAERHPYGHGVAARRGVEY